MWHSCEQYIYSYILLNTTFLVANLKGRHHFRELGIDGSIILKFISNKQDMGVWTRLN
jgi:hypothetical protein